MTSAGPEVVLLARQLPQPRGPLSAFVIAQFRGEEPSAAPAVPQVALSDDDLNLALYLCYELHYRGLEGVPDELEWDPDLLAFRARLEAVFLRGLEDRIGPPVTVPVGQVAGELRALLRADAGPSLSAYVGEEGTAEHLREFAVHRSAYQLKEADPHTWGIPRLHGGAKAALIRIQADEYGGGVVGALHSERFAVTLRSLGLDDGYGAYLDVIPGTTLATVNLVSLFGLHRRWRGALVGHLAIFEMASVVPMGRYAQAIRRLGFGGDAADFYDVHVEADALHEVVALDDLAVGFARDEPDRTGDVLFGARAVVFVEDLFARHLLTSWRSARTSLLRPLPPLGNGAQLTTSAT